MRSAALFAVVLTWAPAARAQTDEIECYDAGITAQGHFNLTWHNNFTFRAAPRLRSRAGSYPGTRSTACPSSLIARYSSLGFSPDPNLGDLLFNALSQQAYKRDVAYGLQSEGANTVNDAHTLRAGVYAQTDRLTSNTTSQVICSLGLQQPLTVPPTCAADASGLPSDMPQASSTAP